MKLALSARMGHTFATLNIKKRARGMPKFEVALFNEEVRVLVKQGESHEGFEDSWADTHYVEVNAPNEEMARGRIEKQYPAHRGFVIEQISAVIPDGDF